MFHIGKGKMSDHLVIDATIFSCKKDLVDAATLTDENRRCMIDHEIIAAVKDNNSFDYSQDCFALTMNSKNGKEDWWGSMDEKRQRGHKLGLKDCDLEVMLMYALQNIRKSEEDHGLWTPTLIFAMESRVFPGFGDELRNVVSPNSRLDINGAYSSFPLLFTNERLYNTYYPVSEDHESKHLRCLVFQESN